MRLLLALGLSMFFVTTALATAPVSKSSKAATLVLAKRAAASQTSFSTALYAQLTDSDKNLFFSPLSISTALAMTHAGAAGQTASEMAAALRLSGKNPHRAAGALERFLNLRRGTTKLNVANRIWVDRRTGILPGFRKALNQSFSAGFEDVSFAAPAAARKTINGWVSSKTNAKIAALIPDGILTAQTRLVLTNAVYFKAKWATAFKSDNTMPAAFKRRDGTTVQAQFMTRTGQYRLATHDSVARLELPYKDGGTTMVVLLPKSAAELATLEKNLAGHLAAAATPASLKTVSVMLPKFQLRSQSRLKSALQKLGMKRAFTSAADFSAINGKKNLLISAVIHEAFVNVDEAGTEAAAATAIVVGRKGKARAERFRADRPFVVAIRDDATGAILFLGRVMDPTVR